MHKKLFLLCDIFFVLALFVVPNVHAHTLSESFITINVNHEELEGRLDIAVRDLAYLINIDSNNDGKVTWGELNSTRHSIIDYALKGIKLHLNQNPLSLEIKDFLIDYHLDRAYVVIKFKSGFHNSISDGNRKLKILYNLFFNTNSNHLALLNLTSNSGSDIDKTDFINIGSFVFTAKNQEQTFDCNTTDFSAVTTLWIFFETGVFHILSGFDHLLFLITLLIPVFYKSWPKFFCLKKIFEKREKLDSPADYNSFTETASSVLKVVTAFTIAHSITLGLATLGFINVSSRFVESAIALSVMVTALNNLIHFFPDKNIWKITFFFGLIHGLGFSSVLRELGIQKVGLIYSLIGFNLGVEAGQLLIVSGYLLTVYWIRKTRFYNLYLTHGGSIIIFLIALVWLIERVLLGAPTF